MWCVWNIWFHRWLNFAFDAAKGLAGNKWASEDFNIPLIISPWTSSSNPPLDIGNFTSGSDLYRTCRTYSLEQKSPVSQDLKLKMSVIKILKCSLWVVRTGEPPYNNWKLHIKKRMIIDSMFISMLALFTCYIFWDTLYNELVQWWLYYML